MDILQVSFYGPFFYDFRAAYNPPGKVSIYAPKCPGHKAGIFTAKDEKPLHRRSRHGDGLQYILAGAVFNPSPPPPIKFPTITKATILDVSSDASPAFGEASFRLYVPFPQFVYPLNGSPPLEVVKGGKPVRNITQFATGMRFYYSADLSMPVTLAVQCDSTKPIVIFKSDFDYFDDHNSIRNSDVVFQYNSGSPEDSEHEDASSCFGLIAGIAGLDQWWLCYEGSQTSGSGSFVRAGDDCLAPIMVVQ